jgi:hypothetical protein
MAHRPVIGAVFALSEGQDMHMTGSESLFFLLGAFAGFR